MKATIVRARRYGSPRSSSARRRRPVIARREVVTDPETLSPEARRIVERLDAAGIPFRVTRRPPDAPLMPFKSDILLVVPVDVNRLIDEGYETNDGTSTSRGQE